MSGMSERDNPLAERAPNVTPNREIAIGDWKWKGIAELFRSRTKPDADDVQGLMFEGIQGVAHG